MPLPTSVRLLVVDDEPGFARALSRRLELRGFDVTTRFDGESAVLAARETEFDVAIVDRLLPGMSGEEALRQLKLEHPQLEVILLTGHGTIESAMECIKAGGRHYLQKPCSVEALLAVLREALEVREARSHEASFWSGAKGEREDSR